MSKDRKKLLEETKKLNKENKSLLRQLHEAKQSIKTIKTGNIDALVVTGKDDLKIYTENAADRTYRVLIEKMNEGAVTLHKDGTILYCNSCFAKMVNLPLQKVIGTELKHFIDDSSTRRFESLVLAGRKNAKKDEIHIHTDDDRTIPVLMSVNSFSLDNNFALSIILTDLTLQKKSQEELKQRSGQLEQTNSELETANKELVSFTYVSSHDLQEPLRKIQTFASIILQEEEKTLSEAGKGYVERMDHAAKRMQELIKDLLLYSGISSADRKFEKTDPGIIIDEVWKEYNEVVQEKKATIDADKLTEVNIIPFQFRLLMDNLISNSLKFSSSLKTLQIKIKSEITWGNKLKNKKLSSNINYCHITYTDNGMGFDPQYNERIFEVFQRLHRQEDYEGTGMGLAICRRVIENHKGSITASGKLDKGSRFDIYIPAL